VFGVAGGGPETGPPSPVSLILLPSTGRAGAARRIRRDGRAGPRGPPPHSGTGPGPRFL